MHIPPNCFIMEYQYYCTYTSKLPHLWSINITMHIPHKLPHYGVSILLYIDPLNCLIYGVSILSYICIINCLIMEYQYYNTYTPKAASLWGINIIIHIPHKLPHYGVSILQYIYIINCLNMEYQYYNTYASKLPQYGVSILHYTYPLTASLWSINIIIHIPLNCLIMDY